MKNLSRKAIKAIGNFIMIGSLAMIAIILLVGINEGFQGEGWNLSGMLSVSVIFGILALAGLGIRSLGRDTPPTEGMANLNPAEPSNPDHKRWTDRA